MNNRRDIDKVTKLPFKTFLEDLLSPEPAITKATVEDLSLYFRNDPYFPDTKLPKFFRYRINIENQITDSGPFKTILAYQKMFNANLEIKGNGDRTRTLIFEGHYSNPRQKKVLDQDLMYIHMMALSGKKEYFFTGTLDETPFLPRERCIVLTDSIRNLNTYEFVCKMARNGFRYNSSKGVLYGFEEAIQTFGSDVMDKFNEELLESKAAQETYGFRISEKIL